MSCDYLDFLLLILLIEYSSFDQPWITTKVKSTFFRSKIWISYIICFLQIKIHNTYIVYPYLTISLEMPVPSQGHYSFQFSGCRLILSVYIIMSFDFPFVRLSEFGNFVITLIKMHNTYIVYPYIRNLYTITLCLQLH